jgi:hypothetical protein
MTKKENNKKTIINFGAGSASNEEINEVFPRVSNKDTRERKIKYVYYNNILPKFQPGFMLEWGIINCGFGTTTFASNENGFYIDEECMSKESIIEIINFMEESFWKNIQVINFIEKYSKKKGKEGLLEILDSHYKSI